MRQAQALAFIQARLPRPGRTPSYGEMAAYQGVAIRAAYQHARALERQGVFSCARRHRGICLSPEHVPPPGLPIIGYVAAGTTILAGESRG